MTNCAATENTYLISSIDSKTGSLDELRAFVSKNELLNILDVSELRRLHRHEILFHHFSEPLSIGNNEIAGDAQIRLKVERDMLPYLHHEGRELKLMIDGKKELSIFETGSDPECLSIALCGQKFDELAPQYDILKTSWPGKHGTIVTAYFKSSANWKCELFKGMQKFAEEFGYNNHCSYVELKLLGYDDEAINIMMNE